MKRGYIILSSVVLVGLIAGWALREPVRAPFQSESTLKIDGTSTLHDWTCETSTVGGFVTLDVAAEPQITAAEAVIPVATLDCGHKAMNGRLQKEMKNEEHPNVQYRLTGAEVASSSGNNFVLDTEGQLTVAGVTQPITMQVNGEKLADGRVRFTGSVPLKMTTFNVKPVVFLGIRTGDDMTISFNTVVAPPAQ